MDYSDPSNPNGTYVPNTPSIPATIVTSGASRTNYANNVNSLNTANNNIRTVQAGQTASGIAASLGMTPEQFLKINPNFAAMGNAGDFNGLSGLIKAGQTYNTVDQTGKTGADTGNANNKTGSTTSTGTGTDVGNTTSKPVNTVTNSDGSFTDTNADGSATIRYSDGNSYNLPAGLDPMTAKLATDNIRSLEKNAQSVKANMDAATATLANDPAAQQAAAQIKAQYDTLIQQMKDKNAMLQGSYAKTNARSGMLQYANEMNTNFNSMELDKANQRVADLVQKENDAIAKSNAAYQSGDVKALDAAQKEYQATLNDKQKSIMDFAKLVSDQVKANDAEAKQATIDNRNAMLDSMKEATYNATDVATTIEGMSANKANQYIQQFAEQNGIDPTHLISAVTVAQAKLKKDNLANARTEQLLGGSTKPTVAEKKASVIDNYTNAFIPGATLKDGTPIVDDNGFITPSAFKKAIAEAPSKGLNRAEFIKEFGSKIYIDNGKIPKEYGLTPVEQKLIIGTLGQ